MIVNDSFEHRVNIYNNTLKHNDKLHGDFSELVETVPFLYEHRKHIEDYHLGFGDRAFHYMWYLLVKHICEKNSHPKFLEIGVFKGQIISLWTLIAFQLDLQVKVTGISPLEGNPQPQSKFINQWKILTSDKYRQDLKAGNFYPDEDYLTIIRNLFFHFSLPFTDTQIIKGYSRDSHVLEKIKNEKYSLIYIDGDHSFAGATEDIKNFSPKLETNGFLVMDDASYYIPGSSFWKGHETVSRACEILPSLGFLNVLNLGHNRIYQKVK